VAVRLNSYQAVHVQLVLDNRLDLPIVLRVRRVSIDCYLVHEKKLKARRLECRVCLEFTNHDVENRRRHAGVENRRRVGHLEEMVEHRQQLRAVEILCAPIVHLRQLRLRRFQEARQFVEIESALEVFRLRWINGASVLDFARDNARQLQRFDDERQILEVRDKQIIEKFLRQISRKRIQVCDGNSRRAGERLNAVCQLRETVHRLHDLRCELDRFCRNLNEGFRSNRVDQVFNDWSKRFYRGGDAFDVVVKSRDRIDCWRETQAEFREKCPSASVLEATLERPEQARQTKRDSFQRSSAFGRRGHWLSWLNFHKLSCSRREKNAVDVFGLAEIVH
jgi:hypothetical protein